MKLVVEGKERFKRIISAGYSDYTVGINQSLVEIDDVDWNGCRKADIHWDDEVKKIIKAPYPLSVAELAVKQEQEDKKAYTHIMPDIVKELQAKVQILQEEVNVLKAAKETTK